MDKKILYGIGALAVIVVLGALYYIGSAPSTTTSTGKIDTSAFYSASSPVYYFYQDDCVHCQHMEPIMQDLGSQGYRVNAIDIEYNQSLWTQYNVQGTPTWELANGTQLVGEQSEAVLAAWLSANGAGPA